MKADFSRLTFDKLKHYIGVLHQQGRVWLDADSNEDVLNRLYLGQQETVDIIGGCGAPAPGTAFMIAPNPGPNSDPDDFLIHGGPGPEGHFYVDGILCQLDAPTSYLRQIDFPDPPRLTMPDVLSPPASPPQSEVLHALAYLEVWQRLVTYLEDDDLREIALGGPDTATRLRTIAQVKVLAIPENIYDPTCATASALLPGPSQGTLTTLPAQDTQPPDPCRIPDPGTYTGRENHLYRAEIHDGGDVNGSAAGAAFRIRLAQDARTGDVTLILQRALTSEETDALKRSGVARLRDDDGQTEIVPIHDASGTTLTLARGLSYTYTSAGNATVQGGVARFKWSRDNAAFAVRVLGVNADRQTLTLAGLGRDQATALRLGDQVEIGDDVSELGPARGHLTYVTNLDPDLLTVMLTEPLPSSFRVDLSQERHLILRRWDGWGWANAHFGEVTTPDMNLGDGVHIQFGGQRLQSGDFWLFATRSADGSVERLTDAPPRGIVRHRCPLAILRWSHQAQFRPETVLQIFAEVPFTDQQRALLGQFLKKRGAAPLDAVAVEVLAGQVRATEGQIRQLRETLARFEFEQEPPERRLRLNVLEDCRPFFPSLTQLTSLFYVSGDGQEVTPDLTKPKAARLPLAQPLIVGVATGRRPVAGARVRFQVTVGGGVLQNGDASAGIVTGPDGLARCGWQLDPTTQSQQVTVRLLDGAGQPMHLPVRFTANLSVAAEVAYDPKECANLKGATTVQAAIDRLCQPRVEPGIGITQILSIEDQQDLRNDVLVPVKRLSKGLQIICDAPLSLESGGGVPKTTSPSNFPDAIPAKPTCFVTLDLPWPLLEEERSFWGLDFGQVLGFQPLILGSTVSIQDNKLNWIPTEVTSLWLENRLFGRLSDPKINITNRVLAHLSVKGNFIWRRGREAEPIVHLDGDVFGRPGPDNRVDLRLPSGNGRRGGDFEMWFWLLPPALSIDANATTVITGGTIIGTITGTVHDQSGSVIPGATVILSPPTVPQTATGKLGQFAFRNLVPGDYVVTAQLGNLSAATQVTVPGTPIPIPPIFAPGDFPGRRLDEVRGLGPNFIARLEASGITHPAEVAALELTALAEILRVPESRAKTIIAEARRLLE